MCTPKVSLKVDESLDESVRLWRYMDLARLISLVEKSVVWLARADTFKDRHEGRFPDEMRAWMEKAYQGFSATAPSTVKDADDFQDYLLKNTFISCWHRNAHENMVMWEIYGRDTNAIAVQTTVGRMKSCINPSGLSGHSLLLRPMIYESSESVPGVLRYEDCFFRKRPHFAFEEEVRISLDTYSPSRPTKNTPYGYYLPLNLNGMIETIYVHPDSSDWLFEVVCSITKRYRVNADVKRGNFGNK